MAFRRSGSFSGRSYSFRSRFSRPIARKQRFWCTTIASVNEQNNLPTYIPLLSPAQWLLNASSGNADVVKAKMNLLILSATNIDTTSPQSRIYAIGVDDTSTVGDSPQAIAFYSTFRRIKRWGVVDLPFFQTLTPNPNIFPYSSGVFTNRDYVRRTTRLGLVRQDETLWLVIQASSTGNLVQWNYWSRTLVERG